MEDQKTRSMAELGRRIDDAYERTLIGRQEWVEGSLELAVALIEARDMFPDNNNQFSEWLVRSGHNHLGKNDQAGLISLGRNPKQARITLEETKRISYQHIWNDVREGYPQLSTTPSETESIPNPPAEPVVEPEIEEPVRESDEVEAVIPEKPKEPEVEPTTEPVVTGRYANSVPKESRMFEIYGKDIGSVLCANFQHWRKPKLFMRIINEKDKANNKSKIAYLAKRCVMPDYPHHLKENTEEWTMRLMYPHLPQKLFDSRIAPSTLSAVHKHHKALIETERLFVMTEAFKGGDPDIAFNEAHRIYDRVKSGTSGPVSSGVRHVQTYADDEGKRPVIIRGTRLWPRESEEAYCYDDLRCACGMATSILRAFEEFSQLFDGDQVA